MEELDKEKIGRRLDAARTNLSVQLSNSEIAAEMERRTKSSLTGESIRRYFAGIQWQLANPLTFRTLCEILHADPLWIMLSLRSSDYALDGTMPEQRTTASAQARIHPSRAEAIAARVMALDDRNLVKIADYLELLELRIKHLLPHADDHSLMGSRRPGDTQPLSKPHERRKIIRN